MDKQLGGDRLPVATQFPYFFPVKTQETRILPYYISA